MIASGSACLPCHCHAAASQLRRAVWLQDAEVATAAVATSPSHSIQAQRWPRLRWPLHRLEVRPFQTDAEMEKKPSRRWTPSRTASTRTLPRYARVNLHIQQTSVELAVLRSRSAASLGNTTHQQSAGPLHHWQWVLAAAPIHHDNDAIRDHRFSLHDHFPYKAAGNVHPTPTEASSLHQN